MQAELEQVVVVGMAGGGAGQFRPAFRLPARPALPAGASQPGDNLILSVGCAVGGYFAESERTFILGEPSAEQRYRYEAAQRRRRWARRRCSRAPAAATPTGNAWTRIRAAGLGEYIMHRQGHGIGIQNHEPPWVEDGDPTVLVPGMVVSCEPGIYCPGQGGYRISDTVLITRDGSGAADALPA